MNRPKRTRKDANHATLISQCRQLGMVVYDTADAGGKLPDTFMCWRGKCLPVEIKAEGKRDDLTDGELEGQAECAYVGVDWVIAVTVDDVLTAFTMQPCDDGSS